MTRVNFKFIVINATSISVVVVVVLVVVVMYCWLGDDQCLTASIFPEIRRGPGLEPASTALPVPATARLLRGISQWQPALRWWCWDWEIRPSQRPTFYWALLISTKLSGHREGSYFDMNFRFTRFQSVGLEAGGWKQTTGPVRQTSASERPRL